MITGIILAGGKSSRMGKEKGLVSFQGDFMISHVIRNIRPICNEIIICANDTGYNFLGYPVIPDEIRGSGPAGGILSGLKKSKNNKSLIISCDLPHASTSFLREIYSRAEEYDIILCNQSDRLQPLCGIYDHIIAQKLEEMIRSGKRKMQDLVKSFNTRVLRQGDMTGYPFQYYLANFNAEEDVTRMNNPRIFLLTGPRNGGKSTYLAKMIDAFRLSDLKYAGIGTRAIYNDGNKTGFYLINLENGQEEPLCTTTATPGWIGFGKFNFDQDVLKKGNQIISSVSTSFNDLAIIDELGPMEMAGKGWRPGIDKLLKNTDKKLLIVIRDEILTQSLAIFNDIPIRIINIRDEITPEQASGLIVTAIGKGK
jgi:molybdopterin-guanine dinucleotide biosynthesis protein A